MKKCNFKIGDTVRIIGNSNSNDWKIGNIITVTLKKIDSAFVNSEYTKNMGMPWLVEGSDITYRECDMVLLDENILGSKQIYEVW